METYHGHVRTPADAIILFEACRLGLLPRVQRRLSEKERAAIKSGSVFVWDEREAGMRRWTDGKSWSASRVSGSFLTYREMEGKRGGNGYAPSVRTGKTPDSLKDEDTEMGEDGPDGYRYKPDGLMKQSFSITTSAGQHLHLISYYSRSHPHAQNLMQPTNDPALRHIRPAKGMYPESTVHEQSTVPMVTRGPMPGTPYTVSPQMAGYAARNSASHPPSYSHPGYSWPPSPIATPPGHYPMHPYTTTPLPALMTSANHSPMHYGQPIPPPVTSAPPTAFDRPPAPLSTTTLPPPPTMPQPVMSLPTTMPPAYAVAPSPHVAQAALIAQAQAAAAQAQVQAAAAQAQVQAQAQAAQAVQAAQAQAQIQSLPQSQMQASTPLLSQVTVTPTQQMAYTIDSITPLSKIDPRLISAPSPKQSNATTSSLLTPADSQSSPSHTSTAIKEAVSAPSEQSQLQQNGTSKPSSSTPTSGGTIPSIGAMLNGNSERSDEKPAEVKSESTGSRSASRSPGGTQKTKGPQDIPSEKFTFGEDMRALRALDRAFST